MFDDILINEVEISSPHSHRAMAQRFDCNHTTARRWRWRLDLERLQRVNQTLACVHEDTGWKSGVGDW
jgi:hypothetical protein